ncbi:MAG: YdeI/OmpD-associated family protein [Bacteroidales bacterium]|nr:YdeI/OmpD-associated family protein [Bacteroidales bacterium]
MKDDITEGRVYTGVVHDVPDDLSSALVSKPELLKKWNNLSPLARNEWICWTISVRKPETRIEHINRLCVDILKGKKRPCCFPGCPHRKDSTNNDSNK